MLVEERELSGVGRQSMAGPLRLFVNYLVLKGFRIVEIGKV